MRSWAVVCWCLALFVAKGAWAQKDRYDPGEDLPSFTLKALNGEILGERYISVDRYIGVEAKEPKKAVLVTFFASYCEPCHKEMPLLVALQEAYKDKGLQVVMVSIDTEIEKIEQAKDLAKKNGAKFPVLTDRYNIVAKRFFVTKLPNSYLASGAGKVIMANVGYNDDTSRRLVDEIRKTIGEPTSEPVPEAIAMHFGQSGGALEVVTARGDGAAKDPDAVEPQPEAISPPPPAAAVEEDTKAKPKPKAKPKKSKSKKTKAKKAKKKR